MKQLIKYHHYRNGGRLRSNNNKLIKASANKMETTMERDIMKKAVRELKENLQEIGRVGEWAGLMGYQNPKIFSEKILRYYGVRPQKIMEIVRLESIIRQLRAEDGYSNIRIAKMHSLPDEKTLNNFTNYHTGFSPTDLKKMTDKEIKELVEELWNKIMEEYGVGKVWSANFREGL